MNATATPPKKTLPHAVADILRDVAKETGVLKETFLAANHRQRTAYDARNLAMTVVYVTTSLTLQEIGRIFQMHQSSIFYALRVITHRLPDDQTLAERYAALLNGRPVLRPLVVPGHPTGQPKPTAAEAHAARVQRVTIEGDIVSKVTHGHLHELNEHTVRAKLRDAEQQLTYWQGARFRASGEVHKQAAGARVQLWEMEVTAITRRLAELQHAAA